VHKSQWDIVHFDSDAHLEIDSLTHQQTSKAQGLRHSMEIPTKKEQKK
jgi:hypothetical protein